MRWSSAACLTLAAVALISRSAEAKTVSIEFTVDYAEDWLDTMVDTLRDKAREARIGMPASDSESLKVIDKNGDSADPGGDEPAKDRFPLHIKYVVDDTAQDDGSEAGDAEKLPEKDEDFTLDDTDIPETPKRPPRPKRAPRTGPPPDSTEVAILAGGRFWTLEAIYQRLPGVVKVVAGYTGDDDNEPKYEDVEADATDHVHALRVEFAPKEISFKEILAEYFSAIDPTSLNRQGPDAGKQYRSVLFYDGDSQQNEINAAIDRKQDELGKAEFQKIVTEVKPALKFWDVLSLKDPELSHHNFYNKCFRDHYTCSNPGYFKYVITPKLQELGLSTEDSGDDVNDIEPPPSPPKAQLPDEYKNYNQRDARGEERPHEEL